MSKDNKNDDYNTHLESVFDRQFNKKDRIIVISDEITTDTFIFVDAALTELEKVNNKDITIKIHSKGGNTYDAGAIIGRILECPCRIITKGYGQVMSSAIMILAVGDHRQMTKYSWAMWHECSFENSGRLSDHKATLQQTEIEENLWAKLMANHSSKSLKFWKSNGITSDMYLTPEQLLKYKVIDEVL